MDKGKGHWIHIICAHCGAYMSNLGQNGFYRIKGGEVFLKCEVCETEEKLSDFMRREENAP